MREDSCNFLPAEHNRKSPFTLGAHGLRNIVKILFQDMAKEEK
jgi:hypothetical protein